MRERLLRRVTTIPLVFIAFFLITVLFPVLIVGAVVVDLTRWMRSRRPWMGTRLLGFGWVYLAGEVWALMAMAVVGLAGRRLASSATFALQRAWAAWNLGAVTRFFGLRFDVSGEEAVAPGPILLLSRHASLIDTLLPATYVTSPHGIRLRYVLKKELLADPALDVAGNRLPNCFIDRSARDTDAELESIAALAAGLGSHDGVVIYPEGTRYSEEKRARRLRRYRHRGGPVAEIARGMRRVLPPRPGGVLALLEASTADVVVLMHRGLEGFARVKDMWSGHLVGSRVVARFRRIARADIPSDRSGRIRWLFDLWAEMDDWVVGDEVMAEGI